MGAARWAWPQFRAVRVRFRHRLRGFGLRQLVAATRLCDKVSAPNELHPVRGLHFSLTDWPACLRIQSFTLSRDNCQKIDVNTKIFATASAFVARAFYRIALLFFFNHLGVNAADVAILTYFYKTQQTLKAHRLFIMITICS